MNQALLIVLVVIATCVVYATLGLLWAVITGVLLLLVVLR